MQTWSAPSLALFLLFLITFLGLWILALTRAWGAQSQPRFASQPALDRATWLILLATLSPALTLLYLIARRHPEPPSLGGRRRLAGAVLGLGLLFNLPGLAPLWWEPFAPWTPVKLTTNRNHQGWSRCMFTQSTGGSRSPRTLALSWDNPKTTDLALELAKSLQNRGFEVTAHPHGPLPEGSSKPDLFLYLNLETDAPAFKTDHAHLRLPFYERKQHAYSVLATEHAVPAMWSTMDASIQIRHAIETIGIQGRTSAAQHQMLKALTDELVNTFEKLRMPQVAAPRPAYQRVELPGCLQALNPVVTGRHTTPQLAFDGTWRVLLPSGNAEPLLRDLAQRLPQEGWSLSEVNDRELLATRASHRLKVSNLSSGDALVLIRSKGFLNIHLQAPPNS